MKKIITCLAAAFALAVPVMAQPAMSTTATATTSAHANMDNMFVTNAAIGGMFEVQTSQLALQKSQDEKVKTFAQRMVTDHTKANEELKGLATAASIPVPAQLDEKHQQMLTKLSGLSGTEFDQMYGRAQMKGHNEAVALFEKASQQCTNPQLKDFATKTLPTLKEHQTMAKDLPGAADAGKKHKKKKNK